MIKKEGFLRYKLDGEIYKINDEVEIKKDFKHNLSIVIDRLVLKEGIESRVNDSVETALKFGNGLLIVDTMDGEEKIYSEHNVCTTCEISYPELSPQIFSFNSPLGFCEKCNGLGFHFAPDENKVIENENLGVLEGAIKVTIGDKGSWQYKYFKGIISEFEISGKTPYKDLSDVQKKLILFGAGKKIAIRYNSTKWSGTINSKFEGVLNTLKRRYQETESESAKKYYEKYFTKKQCSECNGKRLSKLSSSVYIDGKSIVDITEFTIKDALKFFDELVLEGNKKIIASEIIKEIKNRLNFLVNVGLNYLTLSRTASTLSGGESQRIRLASQIGSELTGVIYILDEPSIGLHQKDNDKLIQTLKDLRDKDNSVIVIEHDKDTIINSDWIIDIGPGAGIHGGEIVFEGTPEEILASKHETGLYLSGAKKIEVPKKRRDLTEFFTITGASENNLKDITVSFPKKALTLVTGVSGAGKSTLINSILYPVVSNKLNKVDKKTGKYESIDGIDFDKIINIDQSPIGRTPRSNPATYTKVFDEIRSFFAKLPDSKTKGYMPGRFSFNVKGGRCESCKGDGLKKIEMHFLPDVFVPCEVCNGKRFNDATLLVKFKGKHISDILDTSIVELLDIFEAHPKIYKVLKTLDDVGMGYVNLGQPSTTLSGGEAQRIKLAKELSKRATGKTLYILDEPSTGLHFTDIQKLLTVIHKLVDKGNTIVMIEHNLDIIKTADYIVDIGPDGGNSGGELIFQGKTEDILNCERSYTGKYLKEYL
jgi:excinuclease ABC subunit A